MRKYLLDTHTWIWWNSDPARLSLKVKKILMNPQNYEEILLSSISIWELCKLVEKGRLNIACDLQEWIDISLDMVKLRLVQLTPVISFKSTTLPGDFHEDAADQIITATAREEGAMLITKDKRISEYQFVKTYW